MNDTRCVIDTLQHEGLREPAPFVLAGMSLCRKHLVRVATLLEEGSVADVLRAARRGEI